MSEKIKVVICTGTTCFVMGASDILLLEDSLPADLRGKVEIEGSTCLGMCRDGMNGKAPFVSVDGDVMPNDPIPEPHPFTVYCNENLLKPVEEKSKE